MNRISKANFTPLFLSVISTFSIFAQKQDGDNYRVYFLGGQSNMEGFGYNKDLPQDLAQPFKDVYIFHGNPTEDGNPAGGLGKWENLRPGHGNAFSSDGHTNKPSVRFGLELTFAKRLQELHPGEKIAIIKYARGGSSIDSLAAAEWGCWEPDFKGKGGTNQYDYFLRTVAGAMETKDINADGKPDQFIPAGILWMQGEADGAFNKAIANGYLANLKRLMDLMRAALRKDDLPVVIGKISDSGQADGGKVWKFGAIVQQAQEQYAKTDGHAAIVSSTSQYRYSDPWHYDSAGYLDLGKKFAEAIVQLRNAEKE